MLRNRFLSAEQGHIMLSTIWEPDPQNLSIDEEVCGCLVVHDSKYSPEDDGIVNFIQCTSLKDFPSPPLELIQEEVEFMFHLLKSLGHGSSQASQLSPQSENLPSL